MKKTLGKYGSKYHLPALAISPGIGVYQHRIGGSNFSNGSFCPNCKVAWVNYLTLDLDDPAFGIPYQSSSLDLIYCMRCAISWYDFVYRPCVSGNIEILSAAVGPTDSYDEWTNTFGDQLPESKIILSTLSPDVQDAIDRFNRDAFSTDDCQTYNIGFGRPLSTPIDAANQVGGRPFSIQRVVEPRCKGCGETASFIAGLCNDRWKAISVDINRAAQILFYYCWRCGAITVKHSI